MTMFHVKGLSQLLKNLETLPDKVAKNVVTTALREGANDLRDKIRDAAPRGAYRRGGGRRAGQLKRSIYRRDISKKKTYQAQGVYVRRTKGKTDAYYWRFVQWGTASHIIPYKGRRKNRKYLYGGWGHPVKTVMHPGAKASRFVTRTWGRNKYRIMKLIQVKIKSGIKAEAAKLPK